MKCIMMALIAFLALGATTIAYGGGLYGVIRNGDGNAVVGASVQAFSDEGNSEIVTSGAGGYYCITTLWPGRTYKFVKAWKDDPIYQHGYNYDDFTFVYGYSYERNVTIQPPIEK
ncbi:hypothetical protein A2Y85_06345 [candidate division WOR-3 bacterium RBG_13_43_14]|uniref:Carboxypeptidase regulatory-like domain-containing protein n=1 Tax=candidate division WOR-3 bacterium RBG_13_43_14 TaxID=1802590 RepID=A0A1F4UCP6_UNCW3|nr:MAG: hypothetical protein A2Y85_06345 [candidate division WOR-3 bacterium RBG_13_43_14]